MRAMSRSSRIRVGAAVMVFGLVAGCTSVGHVALLSDGELEKKVLTGIERSDERLQGKSCGHAYSLAGAFKNAVADSGYDTMLDVDIKATTGIFVWQNCVSVNGYGLDSTTLPDRQDGVRQ